MNCKRCVNRREFLGAAGAAALVTISGCGDGQLSGPPGTPRIPPGPPPPLVITVADFPGLATPQVLVQVGSAQAAKRIDADSFEAFSMRCTHQGCLTVVTAGQRFDCPCHGSRFGNDGSVINGPFTGEQIQPLDRLATEYDPATDRLTIG